MKIKILIFIIAFLTWISLSWSVDPQHIIVGILVGFLTTFLTSSLFTPLEKTFGQRTDKDTNVTGGSIQPSAHTARKNSLTGFTKEPRVFKDVKRYLWFLVYIPVFIWECLKANIDGAFRLAHPDLPIRPGIVKVKTSLKSDAGLTFLANSLTLKPGTMTVDIDKEKGFLYVHWVNVKTQDIEEATKLIVQRFERILMRIFE